MWHRQAADAALGAPGPKVLVCSVGSMPGVDGTRTSWTYDAADHLIREVVTLTTGPVRDAQFAYDAAGNRTSETINGVTIAATFNRRDQIVQRGAANYTYTANGDLAQIVDSTHTTHYTWDSAGRLAGATLSDGQAVTCAADADGQRVARTVAGITEQQIWDPTTPYGDAVLTTDASGTPIRRTTRMSRPTYFGLLATFGESTRQAYTNLRRSCIRGGQPWICCRISCRWAPASTSTIW